MAIFSGKLGAKMVSVEGVIIRKDGTRVDLGQLSYWHANPLKRWAWNLKQLCKKLSNRFKRRNQHVS